MKINKNIAINDKGLLFNPATGESFTANQIGIMIIKLLKEDKSLSEISESISEEYDVDNHTVEKDILDFGFLLKNHNIVEKDA
ncbi:MAG: PqqD family protein [Bacteroidales bacterium]|nr:PqqD family protein [Bacteroidales bacterium]